MNSGNGNGWMDNFKTFLTKAQEGPNRENRNVYAENHPQYGTRVVVQLIEDQIIPVSLNDNIEKKNNCNDSISVQNLPFFWNTKTQVGFFILSDFIFSLMNAPWSMLIDDIDGIH